MSTLPPPDVIAALGIAYVIAVSSLFLVPVTPAIFGVLFSSNGKLTASYGLMSIVIYRVSVPATLLLK